MQLKEISKDKKSRICKLWDYAGLSVFDISRKTGVEMGIVREVLGLDKMARIEDRPLEY